MANTKKTSTKRTTTKAKTVPTKKPAKKPAGASRKPAEYKEITTKTNTKHSTTSTKNTKHGSEILFGIIIIVLALVIATGTIFYFCCGRGKNAVTIDAGNDKTIAARYVEIPDYQIQVAVPETFKKLSEKGLQDTEFSMKDTKVAYANDDKSVVISAAQTDTKLTNDEVKIYTNAIKSAMIAANAKEVETGYYEVNGHNVGTIKLFNSSANKSYPYRNFAVFAKDDKETVVNFECTEAARAEWETAGSNIIKSLRFAEEDK